MKTYPFPCFLKLSFILTLVIQLAHAFVFSRLQINTNTSIINTLATYTIFYDRAHDPSQSPIDVTAYPLATTATMTATFATQYDLSATQSQIICNVVINSGAVNQRTCTLTPGTNQLVVVGAFVSDSIVFNVTLIVSNIMNPTPAIQTSEFTGSIGSDTSGTGADNYVILEAATFQSCSITFDPTTVNSSSAMVLTLTPRNLIPQDGSVVIQLPDNRWANDISTTFVLPIQTAMTCTQISNVETTISCVGNPSYLTITASNLFTVSGNSNPFKFQVDNFWSPPTNQPSDAIQIQSRVAEGLIDTCTTYITGLTPKTITGITITDSSSQTMIVNRVYTIKFLFTLVDTMAGTDYITITFPSTTNLVYNGAVSGIPRFQTTTSTYDASSKQMTLYLRDPTRSTNSGTDVYINIGDYTAPPSILPTNDFTISVKRNGYILMTGSASLTAGASTLAGSASVLDSKVNSNTTYTFSITTLDAITASGQIKLKMPNQINILATSTSCASITGSGMKTTPICTIDAVLKTIILTNLNSTSSNIAAQTFTIVIQGLQNPPSTTTSGTFTVSTFYTSDSGSLVATGTISGITSTTAVIDASQVIITPSQYIVNENPVTYTFQLTVVHKIPIGGYFLIYVPAEVGLDEASIGGVCTINIGGSSYQNTACTAAVIDSTYSVINFTNPFSLEISKGNYFIARVETIFTNPTSTAPTSSFKIATFWSDGSSIASINSALTIQMNTADSFESLAITRDSDTNYDITSYHFTITQISPYALSSILYITFPSNVRPVSGFVCSMTAPSSQALTCSLTTLTIKLTLPALIIASNEQVSITITSIRNPASFESAGTFTFQTKTSNNLYFYSHGTYSDPDLKNIVPTNFQSIKGVFTPTILGDATKLQVNFDPSNSGVVPGYVRLTLANSFTITSLSCNAFDDIVGGSCTSVSSNTVEVHGTFVSSQMNFSVQGFSSPEAAPSDFTSLISFDANGNKLDQSTDTIIFAPTCTLPCKTCESSLPASCLSCYSDLIISTKIYYDTELKNCYDNCVDGKYENTAINQCTLCNTNCLTCQTTATFCLTCKTDTIYKYLRIISASEHICVSSCPLGFYPDVSVDPALCTACIQPCVNCIDQSQCLTCIDGTFLLGTDCSASCPAGLYIENAGTNECDACDPACLTCSGTITTCTSCASPKILYLNQCLTECPSPLVPKDNTCGPCDSPCKTCSLTSTNCTSCISTSSTPYLLINTCYSVCPETYYENIGLGVCSLCSSVAQLNCTNCSTASTCLTCDVGYVLYQQKCLDYTPSGYVNISGVAVLCAGDCETCTGTTTTCTSCKTKYLSGNLCLDTCPTGFIGINKICQACLSPCRTCVTTVSNCLSCLTTLDPPQYYINNECLLTCPNGTYPQISTRTCQNCQSPCQYCSSLASCTTCLDGYFLEGTSCVQQCVDGFVGINRVCVACEGNCETCQNSTKLCTLCKDNTYLFQMNSSCVTDCGEGLFINELEKKCVYCTEPCNTCQSTPTTCLSCLTGILHNSQCISECPQSYFNISGTCSPCPNNCSSCESLTKCYSCLAPTYLYNDFCIASCPNSHAVIINQQCTKCSDSFCQECTSADVCTLCESDYSLLTGTCLQQCPVLYETNGTHCIQINEEVLSADTTSFPVPFSIAAIVLIIACLMSKLQFSHTFLAGAIFSVISILEWGALVYFLYLYFTTKFAQQNMPLFVGLGALGYLYIMNFIAFIAQNVVTCRDKLFYAWNEGANKCSVIVANVVALLINHKFRNILFCKLFTFSMFSAYLENVSKFRIFNIMSFLSLIHSGGAIFAASIALAYVQQSTQLYYECLDVIVVTSLNVLMAFFNVIKSKDFFYERTPDGFDLNKKIKAEDDLIQKQIYPTGNDHESEIGQFSNFRHLSSNIKTEDRNGFASTQPLRFTKSKQPSQSFQIIDDDNDYSYGSLLERSEQKIAKRKITTIQQPEDIQEEQDSVKSPIELQQMPEQKEYHEISIQAMEIIDDKFDKTRPQIDFTTIEQKNVQGSGEDSDYTMYFNKSDKNVQNTIIGQEDKDVQNSYRQNDMGLQNTIIQQNDQNVQNSYQVSDKNVQHSKQYTDKNLQHSVQKTEYSEIGIQNSIDKGPVMSDKSIQQSVKNPVDQSVQKYETISNRDRSIQHTVFYQEDSVQYGQSMKTKKPSMKDQSIQEEQEKKSAYSKGFMVKPEVHDQSGQKSTIQKQQFGIQDSLYHEQKSLQAVPSMHNQSNQNTYEVESRSQQITQKSYKNESVQQKPSISQKSVQIQNQGVFDEFTEEIVPSSKNTRVIPEEDLNEEEITNNKLKEQEKDEFIVPGRNIKSYEEELEERIRERQRQLDKLKRKVESKQKNMQKRENAMKKNKGSFTVQIGKLYNKGQKSSSHDQSIPNQQQKTQTNANNKLNQFSNRTERQSENRFSFLSSQVEKKQETKKQKKKQASKRQEPPMSTEMRKKNVSHPLKKQQKLVEEENSVGVDRTLEEISVYDDEGERHKIKVDINNFRQESEDLVEIDDQYEEDIVYEGSDDDDQQIIFEEEVRNSPKREEKAQQFKGLARLNQVESEKSQIESVRIRKESQTQRPNTTNKSSAKNIMNYRESQGQINSFVEPEGKDAASTNLYSSRLPGPISMKKDRADRSRQKIKNKGNLNIQYADKSLYQGESSDFTSNIFNPPKNVRSDMEGTIEEIRPNLNKTAEYRSKSKEKQNVYNYEKSRVHQQYPSKEKSRASQQKINQKIKQMIPKGQTKSRRQLPKDKEDHLQIPSRRFTYNNLEPHNPNKISPNKSPSKPTHERKSSLLMAGRAQFNNTEDRLAYKKTNKGSPLKVKKRWDFEREDKELSDSAEEEIRNMRTNNLNRNNNTAQTRVLPFQTDRDETSFKNVSFLGSEKMMEYEEAPKRLNASKTHKNPILHEMETQQIPIKPKVKLQRQYGTDVYDEDEDEPSAEPYIDESEDSDIASRHKNNLLLHQMLDRPDNSDLKDYYESHGNKYSRSKEKKRKGSSSQYNNQTQRIYMQRFDRPRK